MPYAIWIIATDIVREEVMAASATKPLNELSALLAPTETRRVPHKTPSVGMAAAFTANISLAIILATILLARSMHSIHKVIRIILIVVVALGWLHSLLCIHGLFLWYRGDLPLTKTKQEDSAKYVTPATHGRTIEYFVWGSQKPNAMVTVVCHGSNTTGNYFNQFLYPAMVLDDLNVKVISPSFPGHGGSDSQPFRNIADWPKDDLEPILHAEGVDTFIVQGCSYGTAHAMAVASYFPPDRCLAMGLNVPYLPENICRECGFHTDADYVLSQSTLLKPWILLPILSLLSLTYTQIAKAASLMTEGPLAKVQNPAVLKALEADAQRSFLRGPIGQAYEMLNGTTNQQWPDPRKIQCQNVAVWYADDDSAVSPAHGKWLADVFTKKMQETKCKTNIRCKKEGLGHFTYMGQEDRDKGIMTTVLLGMLEERKADTQR